VDGPTTDPEPRLIDTSHGKIAVTLEGPDDAPVIVMVHGIPGSRRDFRYLAPLLTDHFQVVRVEMPGFGSSPLGTVDSIDGWTRVIVGVADALGFETFGVLAHSFGGCAALAVAAREPARVNGLMLVASPGGRMHRGYALPPLYFRLVAAAVAFPLTRRFVLAHVARQYDRRGLKSPSDWRALQNQLRITATADFDQMKQWAGKVACQSLVAHAQDDRIIELAIAREQARAIQDCASLFFDTGGHFIQKTQAREIAAAIVDRFGS